MKRLVIILVAILMFFAFAACSNPGTVENATNESGKSEEVDVRTITLAISDKVIFIGETAQASAKVENGDVGTIVVWKTSDKAIVDVDANGKVTAVAAGKAILTAYVEDNESIESSIEIEAALHVSSLTISESEVSLLTGSDKADKQIACKIFPENAHYQQVIWESSDSNIVTINEDGTLHAVAAGEAIVSATSSDPACTEKVACNVVVHKGVSSITLSSEKEVIYEAGKVKLTAEVLPEDAENREIIWSTSNEEVASVEQDGTVNFVGIGQAVITCMATDGSEILSECKIQTVKGVKSVTLSLNAATLLLGADGALSTVALNETVQPEDATYQAVTWSSSDESIAKVDENGIVQAISIGKATIFAYSTDPRVSDTVKASCIVTVGNAISSISFSDITGDIAKGKSQKILVTISPEDVFNSTLKWESSNENVLKVDSSGTVKAVDVGKATITCSATDGSGVQCSVTYSVIQAVASLKAQEANVILFAGQGYTLQVSVNPADATNKTIEWSSDSNIVQVQQDGTITAMRAGSAIVTATSKDGSAKSCKFKIVVEPSVPLQLESIGFGIYNASLLGLTVINQCEQTKIVDFNFALVLYSYDMSIIVSGSYSLGSPETISAGAKKTIKRRVYGVGMAKHVQITITAVMLSDGTYYYIPVDQQEVCTFSR